MAKQRAGRKMGGHNRGYFYRMGRSWYTLDGRRQVALRYEDGTVIKDLKTLDRELCQAHARWLLERRSEPSNDADKSEVTILEVCQHYIANAP